MPVGLSDVSVHTFILEEEEKEEKESMNNNIELCLLIWCACYCPFNSVPAHLFSAECFRGYKSIKFQIFCFQLRRLDIRCKRGHVNSHFSVLFGHMFWGDIGWLKWTEWKSKPNTEQYNFTLWRVMVLY